MIGTVTIIALVVGVVAVVIPSVAAVVNQSRLFRASGDLFVLKVGNEEFVIDVGSLDRTDLRVIDSATRAVEEQAKAAA